MCVSGSPTLLGAPGEQRRFDLPFSSLQSQQCPLIVITPNYEMPALRRAQRQVPYTDLVSRLIIHRSAVATVFILEERDTRLRALKAQTLSRGRDENELGLLRCMAPAAGAVPRHRNTQEAFPGRVVLTPRPRDPPRILIPTFLLRLPASSCLPLDRAVLLDVGLASTPQPRGTWSMRCHQPQEKLGVHIPTRRTVVPRAVGHQQHAETLRQFAER